VKPRLIVVAGPNGAGKTTITEKLLRHEWMDECTYVNPDIYISSLPSYIHKYGKSSLPAAIIRSDLFGTTPGSRSGVLPARPRGRFQGFFARGGGLLVRPGKVVYSSGWKSRSGKADQPPDRDPWAGGSNPKG